METGSMISENLRAKPHNLERNRRGWDLVLQVECTLDPLRLGNPGDLSFSGLD